MDDTWGDCGSLGIIPGSSNIQRLKTVTQWMCSNGDSGIGGGSYSKRLPRKWGRMESWNTNCLPAFWLRQNIKTNKNP